MASPNAIDLANKINQGTPNLRELLESHQTQIGQTAQLLDAILNQLGGGIEPGPIASNLTADVRRPDIYITAENNTLLIAQCTVLSQAIAEILGSRLSRMNQGSDVKAAAY